MDLSELFYLNHSKLRIELVWEFPVREWATNLLVGAQEISKRVLTPKLALLKYNSDTSTVNQTVIRGLVPTLYIIRQEWPRSLNVSKANAFQQSDFELLHSCPNMLHSLKPL
jgi:hypothetical protein